VFITALTEALRTPLPAVVRIGLFGPYKPAPSVRDPGGSSMAHEDPTTRSSDDRQPGRRALLRGSLAASATLSLPAMSCAAPSQAVSGRPQADWGVQAGDVTTSSGLVWVRSDRRARMLVETSATESFRHARRWPGPVLGEGTDFTGMTAVSALPPGEQIHYRVTLSDPDDPQRKSKPVYGTFRTAPESRRENVRFLWSGDLAGQGWGINPDRGGFPIFEEMRRLHPHFFLNSGDTIYADAPIEAKVELPDGKVWRNVTTEEKSKVAETLAEFRGNFRYNLLDEKLRRFQSQVPSIAQWDDHEVLNNWYPGEILDDDRYTVKDVDTLAARSLRAFSEYHPLTTMPPKDEDGRVYRVVHHGPLLDVFVLDMRTYRNANSPGKQEDDAQGILGERQLKWLKRELSRSRAVWKVIASDMPLGLVVPDGKTDFEAVAQGDPGAPLGRELQLADLLRYIKRQRITGTVWCTTDVHHTAAQHYDPSKAAFDDFEPFWEFVSGPLNAGGFPALKLDGTFGPKQEFIKAPTKANVPPSEGGQYYGQVDIDGDNGEMTVRLREEGGAVLFTKTLQPGRVGQ
jgi:alkaline phosphatase D